MLLTTTFIPLLPLRYVDVVLLLLIVPLVVICPVIEAVPDILVFPDTFALPDIVAFPSTLVFPPTCNFSSLYVGNLLIPIFCVSASINNIGIPILSVVV